MSTNIEIKERFILTNFVGDDLIRKIDADQFSSFLKSRDIKSSGSKHTKLVNVKGHLDKCDEANFNKEFTSVEGFFLEQIKYTSNRIVLTYPFDIRVQDPISSINSLESFMKTSIDKLNFSKIFDPEIHLSTDFKKIFQKVFSQNDVITKVEQIYVRKVEKAETKAKCEFVWIEIDCNMKEVRIHLENNSKNLSTKLQGRPGPMYGFFSKVIQKEFLIIPLSNPQEETLFKLYRSLTSYAEESYLKRVNPFDDEINEFSKLITNHSHLNIYDTIGVKDRIKWVFVRQMIQNDFENFLKIQQLGDGKVKSILFHYDEGGSIDANSGSSNETEVEELDLERQSAYFDTRESIYNSKKLFSITVNWNVPLGDGYTKKVLTRYRAHQNYLMTHFLKDNVSKGVYDNVFPRIREYEKIPLKFTKI